MTKGKRNAVIVMSVAVLLLVSMAVGAGIVGTDKILSFLGGKSYRRRWQQCPIRHLAPREAFRNFRQNGQARSFVLFRYKDKLRYNSESGGKYKKQGL